MVHDLIPVLHPEFFPWQMALYQKWTLKHSCQRAEIVLASTKATQDDIAAHYHTPAKKMRITPLGPGNVPERTERSKVSKDDLAKLHVPFSRYFFTLSTLEPRKNLTRLFEAMEIVAKEPELGDVGLVVAGAKGWKEAGIFTKLEASGIADRVKFLGYVDDNDLPKLFAACEAFVYPSIYEGFGLPVLEAMLFGAPVLTSSQAALMEVGGSIARYFDPLSTSDIAQTMISELKEPRDRSKLLAAGFERASHFTWDDCASKTLIAFREALKGVRR